MLSKGNNNGKFHLYSAFLKLKIALQRSTVNKWQMTNNYHIQTCSTAMCIVEKEAYVLLSYWWERSGTLWFLRKEALNCVFNINVRIGLNQPYCLLLCLRSAHIFIMYVYGWISCSVVAVYEDELAMPWRTDKSVSDVESLSVTMQWCQTPSKSQGIATLNNSQQGNETKSP